MPAVSTVFLWMLKKEGFSEQYAQAKEVGVEVLAEEILDIADNSTNDWMEKNDPDNPGYLANGEMIARTRLRVDTRKWILSKLARKKYGNDEKYKVEGEIHHHHTHEKLPETDAWLAEAIGSEEKAEDPATRTH